MVPGRGRRLPGLDDDGVYLADGRGVEFGRLLEGSGADLRA